MYALAATSLVSLALAAATAERAVHEALAAPGARVEVLGVRGATPLGCVPGDWSAPKPVSCSGSVALRFVGRQGFEGRQGSGSRCEGWAWADVKVFAKALRLSRDVRVGERLADLVEPAETEVAQGRRTLSFLPEGSAASRGLRAGTLLAETDLRVGPAPGDPVTVLVRAGALELTLEGRAVGCARGSTCALLPGGRRVEGRWDGAHLAVEAP